LAGLREVIEAIVRRHRQHEQARAAAAVHHLRNLKYRRVRETPPIDWPAPQPSPTNTGSIAFHRRMGFTVTGPVENHDGPGHDLMAFRRGL
jgi:hypothetical protein